MQIVHVIPTLETGGAERMVITLAGQQARAGHGVAVLAGHDGGAQGLAGLLDPRVELLTPAQGSRRPGSILSLVSLMMRYRRVMLTADIVHTHLSKATVATELWRFIESLASPMLRRPRIVQTVHSIGSPASPRRFLAQAIATRFADVSVAVASGASPRIGRTTPWEAHELQVVPNGIDLDFAEREADHTTENFKLGTLGRLSPDRRPHVYAELIKRMNGRAPVTFKIGGDGPSRTAVVSHLQALAAPNEIEVLGHIADPVEFFRDVSLSVTIAVGGFIGMGGLESISAGVPIVAIEVTSERSIGPSVIPATNDLDELAELCWELSDSQTALRNLWNAQHAWLKATRSSERMRDNYDLVYSSVLGERPRATGPSWK